MTYKKIIIEDSKGNKYYPVTSVKNIPDIEEVSEYIDIDKQIENAEKVKSVNGKTGEVDLDAYDIDYQKGQSVGQTLFLLMDVLGDMGGLWEELWEFNIKPELEQKANKDNVVTSVNGQNGDVIIEGDRTHSSTIVIANYDSHENSKKGADIVIEKGENASQKINEAIQSLKGTGGEVKLMEGNYNLKYGIAINVDGVHLTGIPKSTVLVQNTNWKGNPYANNRKIMVDTWRADDRDSVDVEVSNIYVKGCKLKGSGFACFGYSTVNNCTSENNGSREIGGGGGFYCTDSSILINCTSKKSGTDGFSCFGSSTVSNCTSENSGGNGFLCRSSSVVTNCISKNGGGGFSCFDSSTVTNCISENSGIHGFYCDESSTITNCISENSGECGFDCSSSFEGICGFNTLVGDKLIDNSKSPAIVQYNIAQEGE